MSYKKLRLTDIAKGADVSISTVSRFMNGNKVRSGSAEKIENYLAQQKLMEHSRVFHNADYSPNERGIGLVVPALNSFFFTSTMSGILDAASELGYSVVAALAQRDPEKERRLLEQFSKYKLAGLIYSPVAMFGNQIPDEVELFHDIPIVIVNRRNILPGRVHVYTDNINAGYLATRHLLSRGRRNIGFVIGTWNIPFDSRKVYELSRDQTALGGFTSVDRFRGYLKALEEYNIPFDFSLLSVTSWDREGGARSAAELVGKVPDIDGIIATSDLLSASALYTLQKRGYDIPQDISIIGWGNNELTNFTMPTLTSVLNPTYEMGFSAVNALHRQLGGESVQDIVFDASIVVRNSTAIRI